MTWATGGDFSDRKTRRVNFRNARIISSDMTNASFEGDIGGMKVNGIEVAPLIEQEMQLRFPERKELFTSTPEGMRNAYDIVFGLLNTTFERARGLTEAQRNERVDDEWSVVETIRHLVFAVDAWILRVLLNQDDFHRIGLPFTEMTPTPAVTCDSDARPTFDEAVEVWKDRERIIRDVLATLTPEELERQIVTQGEGYPPAGLETKGIGPLWTILEESWWHNRFMNRDMDVIQGVGS